MRVAVTGGTGFVGAALLETLVERKAEIVALARDPARIRRREDVEIVVGDLENDEALKELAARADIFIHLAGVTHARTREVFHRVNVGGARRAAIAAKNAGAKFIHISSLSARKPDVSPYAASKAESETAVASVFGDNGWRALRLPAIYGPHDQATLPYFKLVKSGFALEPATTPPARASLLFVDDAAAAIAASANTPGGTVYDVGDDAEPDGREWRAIGQILGEVMGSQTRFIRVPRGLVATFHAISRASDKALGRIPSVREGQINEFFHPDWVARDNLLSTACDWRPATSLKEGFEKTVRWYQENGLL